MTDSNKEHVYKTTLDAVEHIAQDELSNLISCYRCVVVGARPDFNLACAEEYLKSLVIKLNLAKGLALEYINTGNAEKLQPGGSEGTRENLSNQEAQVGEEAK